jgi:PAS domain S-box-containing protein
MKDTANKKEDICQELKELQQRTAELEKLVLERQQTEEKLRESEEKYKASFEKSRDAINIFSKERDILDFNQKLVQLSGYSREEILCMKLQDLYPEASKPTTKKRIQEMLRGKTPPIFETYLLTKKGKKIPVEIAVTSLKNCYSRKVVFQGNLRDITDRKLVEKELEKHHAHLEELVEERTAELKKINEQLQKEISERRQAEEVLRESEEKFRSIVEYSHEGIIILDDAFRLIYANDELSRIAGYTPEELIGRDFRKFLDEESKKLIAERYMRRQRGKKVPVRYEFNIFSKDGVKKSVEVSSTVIKNSKGKVKTVAQILDITECKRTEKDLLESEKRFKELWNNAPVAYHTLDTKGIITSVNQTEAKMLGYKPKEMLGKSVFNYILPEQRAEARKRFTRKIFGNHIPRAEDRIYVKKDGYKLHVLIDDILEKDADGKVLGIRTTMVDITDRKQMEEALHETKEKYRTLAENAMDGIYVISPEGGFEYVNRAFEKIFGYHAEEVCNKEFDFFDLIHPEDRKLVKERGQARKNGRKLPPAYSFRIKTKEGKTKHVEVNTVPLPGEKVRVLGILRDISRRKQAEEALRESEERYKTLVQTSPDAVTVTDLMGNITYVSPRTVELHGFNDAEELIGKSAFDFVVPEDHKRAMNNLRKTLKNGTIRDVEYTLLRKNGARFIGELNCAVIKDGEGNPKMFIGTTRDITEHERTKKAIKESEEQFRDLVEKAGVAILIDDKDAKLKYCNKKYAKLFEYSLKEMEKQTIRTLVHPDDVDWVIKYHKDRIKGKKVPSRYECRGIKKDGSVIYIEIDAVALREGGKIIGTRSYIWDITERKRSEEALQISEEKFKTLFNSASDAIFIHDLGGHFLEVNQVACERLGYSRDELLNMALKDIDSPSFPTVVPARNEELDQRGHIFYETVHKGRDGTAIPIELSSRIIEYEGEPVALSIARDITERKRAEEERRKSFERVKKGLEETVNALAFAVEMRDPYTAGHQQRVTKLACAIASEMRLSQERIEGIRIAGIIHDFGKIRVPAEILSWPGRLTDIDFNLIKTHPQVGYDILKKIELPRAVTQIMLQHHERMDGSGYPAGLQGEEILLEARILAVADVVEAMASHRPYRAALGVKKALEEISKNRGILYDPDVVDACLKLFNEKNFKFK